MDTLARAAGDKDTLTPAVEPAVELRPDSRPSKSGRWLPTQARTVVLEVRSDALACWLCRATVD